MVPLLNTDGAIIKAGQTLANLQAGITVPDLVPFPSRDFGRFSPVVFCR
jgi:hypothetical protein